jgi:hypothetical protein
MTPGRMGRGLALLAVLCMLTVFCFPAVQGPYSVVHGPVTVFHAARVAASLRMTIARAGLRAALSYLSAAHLLRSWTPVSKAECRPSTLAVGCGTIVRC